MASRPEQVQRAIGLRIQELRVAAGETQESFAHRLGMLAPNYARIEQGRSNVTIGTLIRIADGLGVDLADLFVAPKAKRQAPGRPKRT